MPRSDSSGPICEVIERESLLSLAKEFGFNTSYQVPSDISPLQYRDFELTTCISVPEVPLLVGEERVLESYFAAQLSWL